MQKITLKPAEIKLIDPRRTSLIPAAVPKSVDPAPIRKKRNRAVRVLVAALAASLLLNAAQAVIIYVLQVGPI